jgi:arsenate reductase
MTSVTIYHNPRCSKSRATLALLQEHGVEPHVIEYLKAPPSRDELKAVIAALGIKPQQLVRKGEEIYKAQFADQQLSDEQWLTALAQHPVLIERPIVVRGQRAVIGRPPENVLALLK